MNLENPPQTIKEAEQMLFYIRWKLVNAQTLGKIKYYQRKIKAIAWMLPYPKAKERN